MQVRLADKTERVIAVDMLVREWGYPIVVRSQFYQIDECDDRAAHHPLARAEVR